MPTTDRKRTRPRVARAYTRVPRLGIRVTRPSCSDSGGGGAAVVAQQPTQTLATLDRTLERSDPRLGVDQGVVEALVRPLAVVVDDELGDGSTQVGFAERD